MDVAGDHPLLPLPPPPDGVPWPTDAWPNLAELLCQAVADRAGVFLVHREDLPPDADLAESLTDG